MPIAITCRAAPLFSSSLQHGLVLQVAELDPFERDGDDHRPLGFAFASALADVDDARRADRRRSSAARRCASTLSLRTSVSVVYGASTVGRSPTVIRPISAVAAHAARGRRRARRAGTNGVGGRGAVVDEHGDLQRLGRRLDVERLHGPRRLPSPRSPPRSGPVTGAPLLSTARDVDLAAADVGAPAASARSRMPDDAIDEAGGESAKSWSHPRSIGAARSQRQGDAGR